MPGIQPQTKGYGHLTHPFFSLHSPSFSSLQSTAPSSSSSSSSGTGSKISPTILFTIVIVALIVFISGLLHLLVRFLLKRTSSPLISQSNRHPSSDQTSGSGSLFQRQLQQLFHLHDSGLDQALIDALPLFLYKEIMGLKGPFDCAVCLYEFSQQDKLRLLPLCSHAFHIDCIDTWLLSNSTCPLCRGTISTPDFLYMENPVFDFDCSREEEEEEDEEEGGETTAQKTGEDEIVTEKRVFTVRLGKFKSTNGGRETEEVETTRSSSSSNLDSDGRRCYSLGSFQYVVGNSNLEVALCCPSRTSNSNGGLVKGRASQNGNSTVDADIEGKKINIRCKGESFSVSKIWLWPKKSRFPSSSNTHMVTPAM